MYVLKQKGTFTRIELFQNKIELKNCLALSNLLITYCYLRPDSCLQLATSMRIFGCNSCQTAACKGEISGYLNGEYGDNFRDVSQCSLVQFDRRFRDAYYLYRLDEGSSKHLRNIGELRLHYAGQHSRRKSSSNFTVFTNSYWTVLKLAVQ
jgi:hypothetical protein